MTTFLKFLLGNNEVRIRRNSFKNSFTKKNNNRRKFVYNTSHSFSVRTNKDKIQSCGELYMGDVCTNESLISQDGSTSLFCTDNTRIEGLIMKNDFESEHCSTGDIVKTEGLRLEDGSNTLDYLANAVLFEGVSLVMDDGSDSLTLRRK